VTDTLGHVTHTLYDNVGQVISTTANFARPAAKNYLGNLT
jgi:hypothetical protein